MLVAALQAAAAAQRPTALAQGKASAATSISARLTVFGVPQQSGVPSAPSAKVDGSLKQIAQRYPSLSTEHPLSDLRSMNPAARFRLSSPLNTPEVSIDAIATGDPQTLKSALQKLGMSDVSVFSNDVGGWLPVNQIANAAALGGLRFARAAMPRTRSSMVATQGDFAQKSAAVRTTYPSLTGAGITVGVLSDSFNCFAQYAQPGSGVPASGYTGYAPFGYTARYQDDQQPSTGQAASTSALPAGVTLATDVSTGQAAEAPCLQYGQPYQLPFTDEGRAILQIVHAVAPDAALMFYTAVNSEADFANGIETLAKAGAKVIDDDVGYPDEPFFQDGLIAQAVNTVAADGVVYFSSAGNDGRSSYENTTPSFPVNGTGAQANEKLLNFDPSGATVTTSLPLSIPQLYPGEYIFLVVGWDQPYVTGSPQSGGATSSLDLCLSGAGSDLVTDNNSFPNSVTCTGGSGLGNDPVQFLIIGNPANAGGYTSAVTVNLTIGLVNGSTATPGRIKFLLSADGAQGAAINSPYNTNSPTIQGHPGAATAAAVGAAFYYYTPQCGTSPATLESYSSAGGDPILFDSSGNRLGTPQVRQKPDFVAPDGVNNTMLGANMQDSGYPPSNPTNNLPTSIAACQNNAAYPIFLGTSAAAPHAAAAAALMLQANLALTATQIMSALQGTALPMTPRVSGQGYDYDNGHGFIQIDAALASLPAAAPTLSVSPTTITVGASATLTWNAINASGCTASGSWSGSQTDSGTQTVTPNTAGTNTYTLTCTGTGGSVSSSATLTINAASTSGGGGHGGGSVDTTTLLSLGGILLASRIVRRRGAGLPTYRPG